MHVDIYTYYITYNINVIFITRLSKLITSNFLRGNRNVKHFRYLVETPGRDLRRHVGDVEL